MFPQKSKFLKRPIGWEDLGKVGSVLNSLNGKTVEVYECHNKCKEIVHIGKENGELFKFCPRCLIKLN